LIERLVAPAASRRQRLEAGDGEDPGGDLAAFAQAADYFARARAVKQSGLKPGFVSPQGGRRNIRPGCPDGRLKEGKPMKMLNKF
jgi:hypothetical protein